jgi:hypothetical protein
MLPIKIVKPEDGNSIFFDNESLLKGLVQLPLAIIRPAVNDELFWSDDQLEEEEQFDDFTLQKYLEKKSRIFFDAASTPLPMFTANEADVKNVFLCMHQKIMQEKYSQLEKIRHVVAEAYDPITGRSSFDELLTLTIQRVKKIFLLYKD